MKYSTRAVYIHTYIYLYITGKNDIIPTSLHS